MGFANVMKNDANWTKTTNGADVRSTTGSAVLNLFARVGGMRDADEAEIIRMWHDARNENVELADNLVLYVRNIRGGGIGERRIGRILLKELVKVDPNKVRRNFDTIVNAGRWDDLYCLEDSVVWSDVVAFLEKQFKEDIINMAADKPISLLPKWMPSCNTSSKETRRLARVLYTSFGLTERKYRKTLSALRKYLDIVEKKMSANQFSAIDYEKVPSLAMTRYRSAFGKHDFERFNAYINAVSKGEAKINASVLYPYDIVRPYVKQCNDFYYRSIKVPEFDSVLEAQWKALPNYVEGEFDVLCCVDVSGSMANPDYQPLSIATSLGIYFAERNKGAYNGLLLSYTDKPTIYNLNSNDTLATRVGQVNSHVGYNTDMQAMMQAVFEKAVMCGETPAALLIISDGEIDSYYKRYNGDTIVSYWEEQFRRAGLKFPKLIMWNCHSVGDHYLDDISNPNVSFISGASASTFKELITLITKDAFTAMAEILTKPVFSWK